MPSNIFLTNAIKPEKINLENNQKVNIYLVANEPKDLEKTVNVIVKNNNEVNLYCLILSSKNAKTLNFNFDHLGNNSISNIYVKALANNAATIKVNCVSSCASKTHKNEINQTIDGLIFDDKSTIQALPCLDININDINAKHTVNIGQVDPEIIFYLNSKGLSELEAYEFLIDNFLNDLNPYLLTHEVNVKEDIKKLMEAKYE